MDTLKNINIYFLSCLLIGLFGLPNQSQAQNSNFIGGGQPTKRAYEKAANKATNKRHYKEAIRHYQGAVTLDSTHIENQYKLGEAARKYGAYAIAKSAYDAVVVLDTLNNYPKAGLYLAQMEKRLGNYPEANTLIGQLETMPSLPSIPNFQVLVNNERNDLDYIDNLEFDELNNLDNSNLKAGEYEVLCLGTGVNTIYSEVSPFWRNERLYYSSLQFDKTDDKTVPLRKFARTLHSNRVEDGQNWTGLNVTNKTTAHFTFTPDDSQMFFTICDYNDENKIECKIYSRDKLNSGWGEPNKLPSNINQTGSTSTHPAVGIDERGRPTLFYVSNRQDGKGGMDIWQVEILDRGKYGKPQNMAINTDEDEITPFFHFESNALYFSSEGHLSRGGHDVFRINRMENLDNWTSIQYLPEPLNTGYNDFSFFLEPTGERGYMASNREGCYELEDGDLACYDIFQVNVGNEILPPCEPLYVVNVKRNTEIPLQSDLLSVKVSDGEIEKDLFPDDNGLFIYKGMRESLPSFTVKYGDIYEEVKNGSSGSQCDTINLTFVVDPCVTSVTIQVLDSLTNEPIIGAEVIIIDNGKEHKEYIDERGNPAVFTNIFENETYLLIINAKGYQSQAIDCQPIRCVRLKHKYYLIPNPPPLPPLPPNCTTEVAIQVFDSLTNEPIIGAEVIIIEAGKEHKQVNEEGNEFKFTNIFEELEHLLIINKEGYQTKIVPCRPVRCGLLQAKIHLIPNEPCVPNFEIAVFKETKGLGQFLDGQVYVREGSNELLIKPEEDGIYRYKGKTNTDYYVYVEVDGKKVADREFSRAQLCGDLEVNLKVPPNDECSAELKLMIYDETMEKRINNATVTFFELGSILRSSITARAVTGKQELTTYSNEFVFSVDKGNAYMIIIDQVNYFPDTIIVEKVDCDAIERKIGLKPKSCEFCDFLPLTCYFENAIPRPERGRTPDTVCTRSYNDFYRTYYTQKNISKYQLEFGRAEADKANRDALVSDFFFDDVKSGHDKLNAFRVELLERLKAGQSFKLSIRGFCSNLATSDYNQKLAHRRVWSIKNYFIKTYGPEFKPFINNGRLELVEIPIGEVGQGFDNPKNRKDAVYNPISARQRKVVIERADVITTLSSTNEEE